MPRAGRLRRVIQARDEKPAHVDRVARADAHTAGVAVHQVPAAVAGLVDGRHARQSHHGRRPGEPLRDAGGAARDDQRADFEDRDDQEHVAGQVAGLLVLLDRRARTGHALDGAVGVGARFHREHRRQRAAEQQHGGRGPREGRAAGE